MNRVASHPYLPRHRLDHVLALILLGLFLVLLQRANR